MLRRKILETGAMVALGVNYAGAFIITSIWNYPTADSKLLLHISIVFAVSILFGAIIVDLKKALLYTIGSIVVGLVLATTIMASPSIVVEGIEFLDASVSLALIAVSRLLVVGVTFVFLGIIIGCFVGEAIPGQPET